MIQKESHNLIIFSIVILLFLTACQPDTIIKSVIEEQIQKYPEMAVQDIYKLLYQSCYGVKHLLEDTIMSKTYLYKEFESIEAKDEPLFENISGDRNIIRLNLKSFKNKNLPIDNLFEVMKISADKINGNSKILQEYWKEFESYIKSSKINYNLDEIKKYGELAKNNPKEVHHSNIFTEKYSPSYRVVRKDIFLKYFPEVMK